MGLAIGIDLGTSTSQICVYRMNEPHMIVDPSTKSPIVPSLVAMNRAGEIVVGEQARTYVDDPGRGVREVKRKMGSGEQVKLADLLYRPEQISALILKKLKANAEEALGEEITEVVLSVPANFTDAPKAATMAAGELAGLKILRLIPEPTSAALAFGITHMGLAEQLMVFDFGGGTLDISILEMAEGVLDVKCSFGNTQLGGKDFDEVMIRLLLEKFRQQHPDAQISARSQAQLKLHAEAAKRALSDQQTTMIWLANFAVVANQPVDLEVTVSRDEFEAAVQPLLDSARDCILQTLAIKQLLPDAINRVLLVGGTTYMPCVRKLIVQTMGQEPARSDVNPDLAVAMGAAIAAGLATNQVPAQDGPVLIDVCPHGLGIQLLDQDRGRLVYDPLIKPNTTIPYSVNREYRLIQSDQSSVKVRLLQDHLGRARYADDAVDIGIHAHIDDIPPAEDGVPHLLEVEFSYNVNQLVTLKARIPATGQTIEAQYDKSSMRMAADEIEAGAKQVDELWQKGSQFSIHNALLEKAKRLAANDPAAVERVATASARLQTEIGNNNPAAIKAAADELTDLLFDLENA